MKVRIEHLKVKQLREIAKELGIKGYNFLDKAELIEDIEYICQDTKIHIFEKNKRYAFSKKKYEQYYKNIDRKYYLPYDIAFVLKEADGKTVDRQGYLIGEVSVNNNTYRVTPDFCIEKK